MEKIYDLIIIGADAGGLTAGIYAGRKKLNALILSKKEGGQSILTDTIENFPGFDLIAGKDLIAKIRAQAEKFGVSVKEGEEVESISQNNGNFTIKTKTGEFEAKSVIIATGKNPIRLGIPGEKEFENKGVSFCSICDAPLFGGKDVAIIGSGNSGLESATDLLEYANKIYVLEYGDEIKGDESTQEKLKKTGKVEFIVNAESQEIKGGAFVEKIIYKDRKTDEQKELAVGGVFVNIGWLPASAFLKGFLEMNPHGEIIINQKTNETSVKGVFGAGDVTDVKYKQSVIAASEGAKASLSAYDYLNGKN